MPPAQQGLLAIFGAQAARVWGLGLPKIRGSLWDGFGGLWESLGHLGFRMKASGAGYRNPETMKPLERRRKFAGFGEGQIFDMVSCEICTGIALHMYFI